MINPLDWNGTYAIPRYYFPRSLILSQLELTAYDPSYIVLAVKHGLTTVTGINKLRDKAKKLVKAISLGELTTLWVDHYLSLTKDKRYSRSPLFSSRSHYCFR